MLALKTVLKMFSLLWNTLTESIVLLLTPSVEKENLKIDLEKGHGCALEAPRCLRQLTFAFGRLEKPLICKTICLSAGLGTFEHFIIFG